MKIPLRDGTVLAATLYLPESPGPVAAALSVTPYRKDDFHASFDEAAVRSFAEGGYASLVVDMRGCGASEGFRWDAFDADMEGRDGYDIVEWVASQRWCDGNVGMWGLSYPGAIALETAAKCPPHLKAIAPMLPPAEARELWYPGGARASYAPVTWSALMSALDLLPPSWQDNNDDWHSLWLNRLKKFRDRSIDWRAHPDPSDTYWASKRVDPQTIGAATLLIGAWRDLFPREVLEVFHGISAPKKMLIGPWEHEIPNQARVAPVNHLELIRRWFDSHLKDRTSVLWENDYAAVYFVDGANCWRGLHDWPLADAETVEFFATGELGLSLTKSPENVELPYSGDPRVGAQSLLMDGLGTGAAGAQDQTRDDAASLAFTSAALADDIEILGSSMVHLNVVVDHGDAVDITVKLCDVAPDGTSTLITFGSLLVSGEAGDGRPAYAVGESFELAIELWPIAYRLNAGHRLRIAIATADFPNRWPTAQAPRIRVRVGDDGGARILLRTNPVGMSEPVLLPLWDEDFDPAPLSISSSGERTVASKVVARSLTTTSSFETVAKLPHSGGTIHVHGEVAFTAPAHGTAFAESAVTARLAVSDSQCFLVTVETWQTRIALWGRAVVQMNGRSLLDKTFQHDSA